MKLKRALRRLRIHNLISATGSGVLTVTLTVSTQEPVAEMIPLPDDNDERNAWPVLTRRLALKAVRRQIRTWSNRLEKKALEQLKICWPMCNISTGQLGGYMLAL